MSTTEEYKKIIQESFLSKQDKEILHQQLENNGVTKAFIKLFNDLLIAETDARIALYEKSVDAYESECSILEEKYAERRLELEKKLDEIISSLDRNELEKKKSVFDTYYADLKKLQEEILKELKTINARHSLPFIQKAYEV